ncbi:MAG TPA: hypothetical protein DCQ58_06090, partial [Saprospirales bacterium]|nr:hypothetical protein [Saprospirales bacterium]
FPNIFTFLDLLNQIGLETGGKINFWKFLPVATVVFYQACNRSTYHDRACPLKKIKKPPYESFKFNSF